MTTYIDPVAVINKLFAKAWGKKTDVAYEDTNFDPPSGKTWVRLNIKVFDGYQASIGSPGNNRQRRKGLVTVQVFQPQGKAGIDARAKAKDAVDVFMNRSEDGITFKKVYPKTVGNDGNGYYQAQALALFEYDDIS
ncbi:MAG: hypothetical protein JWO78_208 [Micavibrio sp.]|nr:hypothetical protein [Micavibrio sp.]